MHPLTDPERTDRDLFCADISHHLRIMISQDMGHWFPNQAWQNCDHLSVSRMTLMGPVEADEDARRAVVEAVFDPALRSMICHEHRPRSPVHHYRVFFDEHGQWLVPHGEMYTRAGTHQYFVERETAFGAIYAGTQH